MVWIGFGFALIEIPGLILPMVSLLEADGYQVERANTSFDVYLPSSDADVLVMGEPRSTDPQTGQDALTSAELLAWVEQGGGLLIGADQLGLTEFDERFGLSMGAEQTAGSLVDPLIASRPQPCVPWLDDFACTITEHMFGYDPLRWEGRIPASEHPTPASVERLLAYRGTTLGIVGPPTLEATVTPLIAAPSTASYANGELLCRRSLLRYRDRARRGSHRCLGRHGDGDREPVRHRAGWLPSPRGAAAREQSALCSQPNGVASGSLNKDPLVATVDGIRRRLTQQSAATCTGARTGCLSSPLLSASSCSSWATVAQPAFSRHGALSLSLETPPAVAGRGSQVSSNGLLHVDSCNSLEQLVSDRVEFTRNIGLFMAVMIGIGAMMGPGIFALPSEVAHMVGPLGVVVYLAMGLATIFTALNYAELGAAIPLAGGGYSFAARMFPKPVAFITGWFFWIGNIAACSMYAVIFALTIQQYFWPEASLPLITLGCTVVFGAINLRGMSAALKVITVMNLVELAVLIGIAVIGAFQIEAPNLEPFAPHGYGSFASGMALVYISYVGFELITVASEEIIAPGKNIPRAILITLFVGIAIYVGVVFVMFGVMHHEELAQSQVPFIDVAAKVFGDWGRWAAISATIMASLSAFSVTLGASARVLYALSRDGHFPRIFAKLHPRFRTPHIALGVCCLGVAMFAAAGAVKFAASLADFGFLMALGAVNFAVISLHRKMPNLRRPFRPGLYPWLPILGVFSCWIFVPALELRSIMLGLGLTMAGFAVYMIRPANRAELLQIGDTAGRARAWWRARKRKTMRVLIIDGGNQGQNIANRLLAKDEARLVFRSSEHQITFIEADAERCEALEARYNVPIFQGDGTKKDILDQVGLDNIDVAIAASDDDGRNVIAALQAKQLGMKRVIAIVQDPDYLPLLEKENVVAISAPWATAAMVENYLDRPGVAELFEIGTGVASLLGVIIPEGARVAHKQIKDIEIPDECVVAAVIRGKKFVVPRGDTTIEVGDEVVFVGPASDVQKANDMFVLKG